MAGGRSRGEEDDEMGSVMAERYSGRAGQFTGLEENEMEEDNAARAGKKFSYAPAKSIEGWILIVTGIHEETQEDSILEAFEPYGEIKGLHLNLDRRTGYVKGYALIEFAEKKIAERVINEMEGSLILGKPIHVEWAFTKAPRSRINL